MHIVTSGPADCYSFDILYTDQPKAFDRVSNKKLIAKVSPYGINANVLDWKNSFFSNRKQRMVMGDRISDWVE
jgi:hypothetical protein